MRIPMRLTRFSERTRGLLPASILLVGSALALRRLDDFDTWWHLASGRWIVDNRVVPTTDTLSFTVPDHPWINLQWLYDVVLYLLYSIGGADLLVIASAAAYTTALWIMMKNLRQWLGVVPASLLSLWAILIAEERFIIRPEMVSFLLLQAVLWILMTARRNDGRRLWLLAPVMLLWVNCHSLFIIGLFCIGCAVAGVLAAKLSMIPPGWRQGTALGPTGRKRLFLSASAAVAVTLLNPYFMEGALFPLKLLSRFDVSNSAFQAIGEFRRPFSGYVVTFSIRAYKMFFFSSIAAVCVAALVGFGAPKKEPSSRDDPMPGFNLAWLAIFGGLAWLSVLARRNVALFAIGATPIFGACLALIGRRMKTEMQAVADRLSSVAAPVLLAGCVALVCAVATNTYSRWNGFTRDFGLGTLAVNFPIRAAAFAREVGLPPRMYNDMAAGGYLTWDPPVEGGVFIDGRLEVYDTEFLSRDMAALSNAYVWRQQVDTYGIHTVLLFHRWGNRHGLIRLLVGDPAWKLIYHDEVAVIFVSSRGNEATITKAREIYPAWHDEISKALRTPTSRWQWPLERVTALNSYAALLSSIGENDSAVELYRQLLAYRLRPRQESVARIHIGLYLAQRGEREQALAYLERAAALDPSNRALQEVIRKIRDWVPAPS